MSPDVYLMLALLLLARLFLFVQDGYAVVASDGATTLRILDNVTAGYGSSVVVTPGTCVYITTGAPVPDGADAVVPIEWTGPVEQVDGQGTRVAIMQAVTSGTNIRPVGCDLMPGTTLLHCGQMIGPGEIGLLASVGITEVHTLAKPLVGVLSTGDEIVDCTTDAELQFGQIRDANRPMLLTLAKKHGANVVDLGLVADVVADLESKILGALEKVDILVLSGGVSMGALDLLKPLLQKLGTIHFGRLNMKPGKPTTFATIPGSSMKDGRKRLIFGLPGNPVSSCVTAQLLLVPAILTWRGVDVNLASHGYPLLSVELLTDLTPDGLRPEYHRVHVSQDRATGEWMASSTGNQISSRLLSVCQTNGMVVVPAGKTVLKKGTKVQALITGDLMLPKYIGSLLPAAKEASLPAALVASPSAPHAAAASAAGSFSSSSTSAPSSSSTAAAIATTAASAPSSSAPPPPIFDLRVNILTVSDRCSKGELADVSGPAIKKLMSEAKLKNTRIIIQEMKCVPDEMEAIASTLKDWCDRTEGSTPHPHPHLILTSGGTGFAPRDITPEAVGSILHRDAHGFVHAMLAASLRATPMGALSRPVAGIRNRTLILTLPGSPKAVPEILEPIINLFPHACKLMQDTPDPHPTANK